MLSRFFTKGLRTHAYAPCLLSPLSMARLHGGSRLLSTQSAQSSGGFGKNTMAKGGAMVMAGGGLFVGAQEQDEKVFTGKKLSSWEINCEDKYSKDIKNNLRDDILKLEGYIDKIDNKVEKSSDRIKETQASIDLMVENTLDEMNQLNSSRGFEGDYLQPAINLFKEMSTNSEFDEFLTLPAYKHL